MFILKTKNNNKKGTSIIYAIVIATLLFALASLLLSLSTSVYTFKSTASQKSRVQYYYDSILMNYFNVAGDALCIDGKGSGNWGRTYIELDNLYTYSEAINLLYENSSINKEEFNKLFHTIDNEDAKSSSTPTMKAKIFTIVDDNYCFTNCRFYDNDDLIYEINYKMYITYANYKVGTITWISRSSKFYEEQQEFLENSGRNNFSEWQPFFSNI